MNRDLTAKGLGGPSLRDQTDDLIVDRDNPLLAKQRTH
jgi:hypothetical protein